MCASAFVLVAKLWTRVSKPQGDWWGVELNFTHCLGARKFPHETRGKNGGSLAKYRSLMNPASYAGYKDDEYLIMFMFMLWLYDRQPVKVKFMLFKISMVAICNAINNVLNCGNGRGVAWSLDSAQTVTKQQQHYWVNFTHWKAVKCGISPFRRL